MEPKKATAKVHTVLGFVAATAGAVALAACGSTTSTSSAGTTTSASSGTSSAAVVGAASVSSYGKVLVDSSNGETLYLLTSEKGGKFTCTGKCLAIWPPLTVPSGTSKVSASGVSGTLSLVKAPDGKLQVTDNGYPLYRFSGDTAKGQTKGQGIKAFGGTWWVVSATASSASSSAVTSAAASTSSTTAKSGYGSSGGY